jgi:squalene-hopene/tetraprenyl-beta-curcumene cyclase
MVRKFTCIIFAVLVIAVLFTSCSKKDDTGMTAQGEKYSFPLSLQKEMKHSLEIAYQWLISQQFKNGSWKMTPAISALALYALVENPGYVQVDKMDQAVQKGFAYLRTFVQKDGGIYQNEYRSYTTAVALMAFAAYGREEDRDIVEGAKKYLMTAQFDEGESMDQKNVYFGGIGYEDEKTKRPDLSNTQFALDALKESDEYEAKYKGLLPAGDKAAELATDEEALCWQKALVFLARCQNAKEVNKETYRTDDDGGFMYDAGKYKEDMSHSYGSMTYAGVKSLLYAKVDKSDIRVQRALEWIRKYYTLDENPQFGQKALYYYYMTFAKCLNALGDNVIADSQGKNHYWREEITRKLISKQSADGSWVNSDGSYWENLGDLATSYSIIALKYALAGLSEDDII